MKIFRLHKEIEALPASSGIYRIYNRKTGACYVGASRNIRTRCFAHFSRLPNGLSSKALTDAFRADSVSFSVEVLELCATEELKAKERQFIDKLRPVLNSHPYQQFDNSSNGDLITVNEAAKIKGVTRQAIFAAIERGDLIPTIKKVTIRRKLLSRGALENYEPNPNMKRPKLNGHSG